VKNQEPLYENPILFYMHIIFLAITIEFPCFFFSFFFFQSLARYTNGFVMNPVLFPISNHWGTKSHAHIIHGLPGRFYRTVVHSQKCVFVSFASCFVLQYPCLLLIRGVIDLAHDAAAALGHAGSHGGNGSSILTTETLGLHTDTGDVGLACGVPHGDVLFHAARQAGVLLG
jgi:hypothetical protein